MNDNVTEAGKGLGIASLVLGILALVISFIPCLGMYALFPGVISLLLGIVAYIQANKGNGAKGIIIAALVISILGSAIAAWQYSVLASATSELFELGGEIDNMSPEELDALGEELENVIEETINEELDDEKALDEEIANDENGEANQELSDVQESRKEE